MALTRHELRYKTMTILYQANLYDNNNIEYNIDNSNFNIKDNYRLDYFLSKRI